MGKKRKREGKYLFFHSACVLAFILLSSGCAHLLNFQKRWEVREHVEKAENLMFKGSYEEAIIENERILSLFPHSEPGDKALFNVGLIHAYPDNPKRDYKKSLIFFQSIINGFSQSRFREKAIVLASIITDLIRSDNNIKYLEKTVDYLKNSQKEYERNIEKLKEQLRKLKEQLRKLKEIDIVIEEKKRVRLHKD
jgi:cell division protein FtsB